MRSLEELEKRHTEERARLIRDMELASTLPTNGKTITWMGEDGWDKEGKLKPLVEKSCQLFPYIIHDNTAYNTARHVAYKTADSHDKENKGESTSSSVRNAFVKQYILAVVEAFKPYLIQITAVKGPSYSGHFPERFDFTKLRSYENAKERGHGDCEVYITRAVGQHSFCSGKLSFYALLSEGIRVKVDLEVPGMHLLAPVHHTGSSGLSWSTPQLPVKQVNCFTYSGGDNYSKSLLYLFNTIDDAFASLKFNT